MKLETTVLVTKGLCYIFIGFTAPMGTALAQWANEGKWPPAINWLVILGVCVGSAAASMLAFLSGSYRTYMDDRNSELTPVVPATNPPQT